MLLLTHQVEFPVEFHGSMTSTAKGAEFEVSCEKIGAKSGNWVHLGKKLGVPFGYLT